MRNSKANLRFYAAVLFLAGALGLFYVAKAFPGAVPDAALLNALGAGLSVLYLVYLSTWALHLCLRHNYSLWLAPLSGGLAGIVLGVGLEFLFLQGSSSEGLAVNGCLAAGTAVSLMLFSTRFLKAHGDARGRSGRLRSWV